MLPFFKNLDLQMTLKAIFKVRRYPGENTKILSILYKLYGVYFRVIIRYLFSFPWRRPPWPWPVVLWRGGRREVRAARRRRLARETTPQRRAARSLGGASLRGTGAYCRPLTREIPSRQPDADWSGICRVYDWVKRLNEELIRIWVV